MSAAIEVIGTIGGTMIALSLLPQAIYTYKTKSAGDISYVYQAIYIFGTSLVNIYAIILGLWPVYIPCLIEESLIIALTVMKLLYDRNDRRDVVLNSHAPTQWSARRTESMRNLDLGETWRSYTSAARRNSVVSSALSVFSTQHGVGESSHHLGSIDENTDHSMDNEKVNVRDEENARLTNEEVNSIVQVCVGVMDDILAKRKENQRLEEERIKHEQNLSEKRKEAGALKARAPTTTPVPIIAIKKRKEAGALKARAPTTNPVPIIADINDNLSMGNADDMEDGGLDNEEVDDTIQVCVGVMNEDVAKNLEMNNTEHEVGVAGNV